MTQSVSVEAWRPWLEYEVSDEGRIRKYGRILKQQKDKHGYLRFSVRVDGKQKLRTVHSIVLEAFVGQRPDGMEIAHRDGTRTNNRLSNLSYVTAKENRAHAREHGTIPAGERHGRAKLTMEQVMSIRARHIPRDPMYSARALARTYGVDLRTIRRVIAGEIWK